MLFSAHCLFIEKQMNLSILEWVQRCLARCTWAETHLLQLSQVLMLISQRLTWQLWLFQALHLKSFQLSFISVFFFHFLFNLPNLFWCCFLFALEMAWIYHEIHLCHFFMFEKNVMVSLQALQVWSGCNHLLFY